MKKEGQALYFSVLINLIVATLKLIGGFLYGSLTLIADGYYTVCDFITDIIALISAKISHRRANKKFPFGYGRVEYINQTLIGLVIFIFGIFTIINSFNGNIQVPNLNIVYVIIFVIFLKTLSSNYLYQVGKKNRSQILISASKESFVDVVSSMVVLFIVLTGQFMPMVDIAGSFSIGILIVWTGLKIIISNVIFLVGEDENDSEVKKSIEQTINSHKEIIYSDSALIKNGSYYQASIEIAVPNDMSVKELIKVENKIRKELKQSKYRIKFIDFDIILK